MATPAEVAALRQANAGIVALLLRDLDAFWASLDLSKPERVRDALVEYLPVLVAQYGELAAVVAADWFDQLRLDAVASGAIAGAASAVAFRSTPAPVVPAVAVVKQVRFGAQHLFTDNPEQTLKFLQGESQKYALQPGRDTITRNAGADRKAVGWQRVTRAGSCDFCQRLSRRGAVYQQATATFESHHACNCVAVPVWADPTT